MSEADSRRKNATELALIRKNRRVLAERLRWPAGVLDSCEALDVRLAGWTTSWVAANTIKGFESEATFIAWRLADRADVRAPDPDALAAAALNEPEHDRWVSFRRRRQD